jgi:hypothetical protein
MGGHEHGWDQAALSRLAHCRRVEKFSRKELAAASVAQ